MANENLHVQTHDQAKEILRVPTPTLQKNVGKHLQEKAGKEQHQ